MIDKPSLYSFHLSVQLSFLRTLWYEYFCFSVFRTKLQVAGKSSLLFVIVWHPTQLWSVSPCITWETLGFGEWKWHWDGNGTGNTCSKSNNDRKYSLLKTLPYQRMLHGISDQNINLGTVLQQTYFCSHWFNRKAGKHIGLVLEFNALLFLWNHSQEQRTSWHPFSAPSFLSCICPGLLHLNTSAKVSQDPVFGQQSLLALWPFLNSRQNNSTEPVSCIEPLTSDHTRFSQCPTASAGQ